jgi:AAA+ ATPase superfamily predicted ATPase
MIGRIKERKQLDELLRSPNSELVAIIGRRRVGKTYLIREHYKKQIVFDFTGTQDATIQNQLKKFTVKLADYGTFSIAPKQPEDWAEAFGQLKTYLEKRRKTKHKRVVFFDELPWIDTHRSGFLNELAYWWNDWASKESLVVVICGSAASWMIHKVINNKGGLHNRVTTKIHLQAFTLSETRQYINQINPALSPYSILQIYMSIGGIPFYLNGLKKGESATQAIQRICFDKDGFLRTEFNNLYAALYDKPENHIAIIKALATKWKGLTRQEIIKHTKLSDGGGLTKVLDELETASFIMSILPFGKKKKDTLFRLVDEYSLFYLNFIENQRSGKRNIWIENSTKQKYITWKGYAFENICIKHSDAITKALGIQGIQTNISSYTAKQVQVDMLIDRADNVINLCEMKFYNDEIQLSKTDAKLLRRRKTLFRELCKTKKSIFVTLVTTYGLRQNQYSDELLDNVVTLDDLYELDAF